jgi:hypothetical protein
MPADFFLEFSIIFLLKAGFQDDTAGNHRMSNRPDPGRNAAGKKRACQETPPI